MLACLQGLTTRLEKLEQEYHRFNFNQEGVTFTFMMMTHPILIQAQIFSNIGNGEDITKNSSLMTMISQWPGIYIPKRSEILQHEVATNAFVLRAKALADKFDQDVPFNFSFMIKMVTEFEKMKTDMPTQLPMVATPNPQPRPALLTQSAQATKRKSEERKDVKAPKDEKKEAEDEGVSFFKARGCFALEKK